MKAGTEHYHARRAELQNQKDALVAALKPARDDYERLVNDPRLLECKRIIKETNAKLLPIENELAGLARMLGGKSIEVEQGEYSGTN